jgi:hypothetical protein
VIAFLVVMSAVVFAWMYSAYFAPADETTPPAEIIPTVTQVTSDTIFLPTPTASPTVKPSPTAEPTREPTTEVVAEVATEEPVQASDAEATVEEEQLDDVEDVQTEEPTVATDGALTFNFTASNDIENIQVVADGSVIFDGFLAAGESTGYVSADLFQIYVTDPGSLQVVRENGDTFYMGDTYFELP